MYVLVAISVVAFLALVWAAVAIAMHVREAGRVKASAAGNEPPSENKIGARMAE